MCWYHLVYNVKKHESFIALSQALKDMVLIDLTRLHYCLEYEYETYKAIVLKKWSSYPEMEAFVTYVVPQWFEGTFSNWQIFKSPPGFAATNNPMESFNKIIKAQFTDYNEQPLLGFILIIIQHLIPFYSSNDKTFMFYRIPHKITVAIAKRLDVLKYTMKGFIECSYQGRIHTHTINFEMKSCTCRWFWSFAVCAHLVAACDHYNYELKGYTKPRVFVYKKKRGRKPKNLTFTQRAFAENPMPIIPLPISTDNRSDMYLIDTNNMPGLPTINDNIVPEIIEDVVEPVVRKKRAYKKKVVVEEEVVQESRCLRKRTVGVEKVKRLGRDVGLAPSLKSPVQEKRVRGRPRKNKSALNC